MIDLEPPELTWCRISMNDGNIVGRVVGTELIAGRPFLRVEAVEQRGPTIRHIDVQGINLISEITEEEAKTVLSGKCPCPACMAKERAKPGKVEICGHEDCVDDADESGFCSAHQPQEKM